MRNALARRLARGFIGQVAREAIVLHPAIFGDRKRVEIAEGTVINDALLNTVSGTITVEPYAFFGHGVSLLTGTHDIDRFGVDRQEAIPREGRDILVEEGAWIASNATVLGPCRIGRHAVVAAGALVVDDVPPYAIVAGVPARIVASVDAQAGAGEA